MPRSLYPRSTRRGKTVLEAPLSGSLASTKGPTATLARNSVAYRDELLGALNGQIVRYASVLANVARFCKRREAAAAAGPGVLENGFAYSEELEKNSFFQQAACTWTPGVVPGPGSTRTAGQIVGDATSDYHMLMLDLHPTSSHVHGFSVFVKPLSQPYVLLGSYDINGAYVAGIFDATTADLVGSEGPILGHDSEVIGSGWLRLKIRYQGGIAQHTHLVGFHNATSITPGSYTGDGVTVDGYIWGAQHGYATDDEGGSSLEEYVYTVGAARILGPLVEGVLVEPGTTQHMTYTEAPRAVNGYSLTTLAESATAVVVPDGTSSTVVALSNPSSPSTTRFIAKSGLTLALVPHVWSGFIKSLGAAEWLYLSIGLKRQWVNLKTGAIGATAGGGHDKFWWINVGGGWYRFGCRFTPAGANQDAYCSLSGADNDLFGIVPTGDAIACWGWNMTTGSELSSYVKSTATKTTREADVLTYSGLVVPNRKLTLQADVLLDSTDVLADAALVTLNDGGSANDQVQISVLASGDAPKVTSASTGGSAGAVTGTTDIANGQVHELRAVLRNNSLKLFTDGAADGSEDTMVTLPDELDTLALGAAGGLYRDLLVRVG